MMLASMAWGVSSIPAVQDFEAKAIDLMQRLEYHLKGPQASNDIVFIAIDYRSVVPHS